MLFYWSLLSSKNYLCYHKHSKDAVNISFCVRYWFVTRINHLDFAYIMYGNLTFLLPYYQVVQITAKLIYLYKHVFSKTLDIAY